MNDDTQTTGKTDESDITSRSTEEQSSPRPHNFEQTPEDAFFYPNGCVRIREAHRIVFEGRATPALLRRLGDHVPGCHHCGSFWQALTLSIEETMGGTWGEEVSLDSEDDFVKHNQHCATCGAGREPCRCDELSS